mmetsp:Transcript_11334/g.16787  ORF Transcript_11334/g.16787 Transcript_11334/m.16787 type:complete len:105 (-) Transcript_11334:46-360(-)
MGIVIKKLCQDIKEKKKSLKASTTTVTEKSIIDTPIDLPNKSDYDEKNNMETNSAFLPKDLFRDPISLTNSSDNPTVTLSRNTMRKRERKTGYKTASLFLKKVE